MSWLDFPLDCHHAAEDKVYSSLWEFHHVFFFPFPNRKIKVFSCLVKIKKLNTHTNKELESKMADQIILDSISKWSWGNITFAILVFCLIYHTVRFLKKLRSLRTTKEKAVKAVDVYIWISFSGYMSKSPS